jgi:integrase
MKAGKPHEIALTETMAELLRATPRRLHVDRVFPVLRLARQKQRLDERSGTSAWVLHDLRRTARTALAELGVADSVADAVLAHTQGGIAGVYNRHSYRTEKAAALARWLSGNGT